jgi:hypothetical protein
VGAIPTINATPITNADKGTVLGWEADMPAYCASYNNQHLPPVCNDQVAAASTFGFASTVDTSLAFSANLAAGVVPVLQAQDGTFFGTDNTYGKMIHFDQYGNTIWSVPNDYPQIATEDGGVIGGWTGITYDSQGRATGQGALPGTPSWQGFMYSVVGDPWLVRTVPPDLFLQVNPNLLNSAGGNPSGTGTTFPGNEDPWSLRLVPTGDNGYKGSSDRTIVYNLFALDGKSNPKGTWYITEHQTFQSLAGTDGMSGGTLLDDWQFIDNLRCIQQDNTCGSSHQTFTISPNLGACASPSYGDPGNSTTCKPISTAPIVVHDSIAGDFGVLWLGVNQNNIQVIGKYRWPGAKD